MDLRTILLYLMAICDIIVWHFTEEHAFLMSSSVLIVGAILSEPLFNLEK